MGSSQAKQAIKLGNNSLILKN